MTRLRQPLAFTLVTLCALIGSLAVARAQDPMAAAPAYHKVLLENAHVRVLEVRVKPGARVPMHEHPEYVAYVIQGGKAKFSGPEGEVEEIEHRSGLGTIKPAEKHAFENVGSSELHVLLVELKPAQPGAAPLPPAPVGEDAVSVCTDCAKVLAENERVRLYEVTLKPGQKAPMHVHPANVVYAISEVRARFVLADGKALERTLPAGTAAWVEPVKHDVENIGPAPARFLHIELKPAAAAAAPGGK